jgi:hypothetical protein
MNECTKEILKKIKDKKTLDLISKEMNIRKPTLKARVESLIHLVFIGEINYNSGCKICPMNCSSGTNCSDIEMFALTEKGRNLINNL